MVLGIILVLQYIDKLYYPEKKTYSHITYHLICVSLQKSGGKEEIIPRNIQYFPEWWEG